MSMQSLEELFVDKLKDIHDAERRITKALPKMIKAAASEELSAALEEHLRVTEGQIERLDRIFETLGKSPGRKPCHGMMGILEEGEEVMEKEAPESVMDAALIAGAQEVEHYEIGSYGTLRTWAEVLGKRDVAKLLQQTLQEEEKADELLSRIASTINREAMEAEGEEEEEEMEMAGAGARSGRSGNGSRSSGNRNGRSRSSGGSSRGGSSRSSSSRSKRR